MISIRLMTLDDSPELYAVISANRDALAMFPWAAVATQEVIDDFLTLKTNPNKKINNATLYAVTLEEKIVGTIEVRDLQLENELGYWIAGPVRGRGYMKEALQQVMQLHVTKQISAKVLQDNAPSLWLLWSVGFKEVERYKDDHTGPTWVKLIFDRHLK